jgi:hypothetical protein
MELKEIYSWPYCTLIFEEESFGINEYQEFMKSHLIHETLFNIPPELIDELGLPMFNIFKHIEDFSLSKDELTALCNLTKDNFISSDKIETIIKKYGTPKIIYAFNKNKFDMNFKFYNPKKEYSGYYPVFNNQTFKRIRNTSMIQISCNPFISHILNYWLINYDRILTYLDLLTEVYFKLKKKRGLKQFIREFSLIDIKSTLAHELSHWLNDTTHNFHIKNMLNTKNTIEDQSAYYKVKNINFSSMEIDAQVHAIAEIKKQHSLEEWNNFSFIDLCTLYSPLRVIIRSGLIDYPKEIDNYLHNLIMRLYREHLLGAKMDYSQVFIEPEYFQ